MAAQGQGRGRRSFDNKRGPYATTNDGAILESIQIAGLERAFERPTRRRMRRLRAPVSAGAAKVAQKYVGPPAEKTSCARARFDQISVCPIRTCLWSCVGRRGSGQEASQPPLEDRQPEANRRTPPNGGRDLKQRRTGLFWSLPALQRSAIKEACLSCRACGRDFPRPNDGPERRSAFRSGASWLRRSS